jgi:hypothetical protein
MAYSFLIFDFGGDEDLAQQARHRIEGWRQAFRLDKKLQFKFERQGDAAAESAGEKEVDSPKGAAKKSEKSKSTATRNAVRMIVRLNFSDHEKLSHVRWLERIPGEEPFKSAKPKVISTDQPDFKITSDLFDDLDPSEKKNYQN